MILKLFINDLKGLLNDVRLTISYSRYAGFVVARRLFGFFVLGVWIRFYIGYNPLIWTRLLECFCSSLFIEDLLHVIPRENFICFISDRADIVHADRIDKIRMRFETAFKLWNSEAYLTLSPNDLADVIKNSRWAMSSLVPFLNFSDWLKLWAVTLQPVTPLSSIYTVYTKTKFLSLNYEIFIRQGLLGCSVICNGVELPANAVKDSYTAFIWVLASLSDAVDLTTNVPDFHKIIKL